MGNNINWLDVEQLQHLCQSQDSISLKLNWSTLRQREADNKYDLTLYRDGILVGFLGRYSFGSKLEICGMVHPAYRRQGIFTSLLKLALDDWAIRNHKEILLNAPGNSTSAKDFLNALDCNYSFSEYQMKHHNPTAREAADDTTSNTGSDTTSTLTYNDEVYLRPARANDREMLIQLEMEGFGDSLEDATQYYVEISKQSDSYYEIIMLNDVPAGKVRVDNEQQASWIYGFVVSSTMRGQGIGGSTLRLIIERECKQGYEVWLEVALTNPNAMRLYQSVGFQVQQVQDYYQWNKN
jgi:ribosomal protein S18 acetylase RimI-like enzyme